MGGDVVPRIVCFVAWKNVVMERVYGPWEQARISDENINRGLGSPRRLIRHRHAVHTPLPGVRGDWVDDAGPGLGTERGQ